MTQKKTFDFGDYIQKHHELEENQIFEEIENLKKEIETYSIQQNLNDKKITFDKIKTGLDNINKNLQLSGLKKENKETIGKAFNKLINLERNTDEATLNYELNEIINLLETLTRKDLMHLYSTVKHPEDFRKIEERPPEIQEEMKKSFYAIQSTIKEATQESWPINIIGDRMAKLDGNINTTLC